jgi:hypothetical protein
MAVKRTITKEEHAKLVPILQAEYKAEGENMVLDISDYEDPSKVLQAKNHERDQRKLAETKVRELTTQLEQLTEERDGMLKGSIPKADAEKLENSWKSKLEKREKELTGEIEAANSSLQTLLVDNVAQAIATEISTAPAVIMPHIKSRLKTEKVDGKFITKVVDKDGKPSALTVDELKKEFSVNPDFKSIITASKASGGGAGGGGSGGGANAGKIDWNQPPSALKTQLEGRLVDPGQPLKR